MWEKKKDAAGVIVSIRAVHPSASPPLQAVWTSETSWEEGCYLRRQGLVPPCDPAIVASLTEFQHYLV